MGGNLPSIKKGAAGEIGFENLRKPEIQELQNASSNKNLGIESIGAYGRSRRTVGGLATRALTHRRGGE